MHQIIKEGRSGLTMPQHKEVGGWVGGGLIVIKKFVLSEFLYWCIKVIFISNFKETNRLENYVLFPCAGWEFKISLTMNKGSD